MAELDEARGRRPHEAVHLAFAGNQPWVTTTSVELESHLAWAKAHNMRLIVMIEDKTFQLERPTPAYLDSYTPRNRAGGYTVVRWNPYVVACLNR